MTLLMGVLPKGEAGLPMLDLHHLPVLVPSLASVMLWMEGGFSPYCCWPFPTSTTVQLG